MDHVIISMLLTLIAGLSTLIGTILVFICKNKKDSIIVNSICFSAGVIISMSLNELIPESINLLSSTCIIQIRILLILIFINIGIIISMFIDKMIPSDIDISNSKHLYKVGIVSMIAIIVHNIPEGIATFVSSSTNIYIGIKLVIAIALHNIPEGISISMPIYYSTNSKIKAIGYAFLSGISEVLGALIAYIFISKYITNEIMAFILAITAGIMLHISFYELLPSIKKYKKNIYNLLFFISGYLMMLLVHFLIK